MSPRPVNIQHVFFVFFFTDEIFEDKTKLLSECICSKKKRQIKTLAPLKPVQLGKKGAEEKLG